MRVTLTRTGGVAGIRLHCSIDSERLSPRDARRLRELLAAANLPSHCAAHRDGSAPDRFNYTLSTEEEDGAAQLFQFGEDVPDAIHALVTWLRKKTKG